MARSPGTRMVAAYVPRKRRRVTRLARGYGGEGGPMGMPRVDGGPE